MKNRNRLIALVLSLVLLFSLCGCDYFGRDFDLALRSGGVTFDEMEYVRPDMGAIRDSADGIKALLTEGASFRTVVNAFEKFYTLYWDFYTVYTLAELRSDIDMSDEYYAEEYAFCMDAEAELTAIFDELMIACTESELCEELDRSYLGGLLEEQYIGLYEDGYEELEALYEKESKLLNDYRELMVGFYAEEDLEAAYRAYNAEAAQIFIELVKVRKQIAKEIGYDSYEELSYDDFGREYGPDDLSDYFTAVEDHIVPVLKRIIEDGTEESVFNALSQSAPADSFDIVRETLPAADKRFERAMNLMVNSDLYNIQYSPNKYDISYTTYIENYNSPFMLVSPVCYQEDILTIAHEFGHFTDDYVNYDMDYNLDTAETMSQGAEYLLLCRLDDSKLQTKLTRYKMSDVLYLYAYNACLNAFEHEVYALPEEELTVEKLNSLYEELSIRYGMDDGTEGRSWIDVVHIFDYPFYVVSYCVSDSAAFSLYLMEREEPGKGLEAYLGIMDDAPEHDFLEALERNGVPEPIDPELIRSIAETADAALK